MRDRPIGVFDSGIGGLTVVSELFRQLPEESVLYIGDTARVPYGPRGPETIARFAAELACFLLEREVKALVIACNTVSAVAAAEIRALSPVPVFDVVGPTVRAAVAASRQERLGVIGTVSTVRSGIYTRMARRLRADIHVWERECPLFVPIAEENLVRHPVARLMAGEYLAPLREEGVDTLILGCTHYPLLRDVVQETMGPRVRLVDSAEPTVRELASFLEAEGVRSAGPARHELFVTDPSYKFLQVAGAILKEDFSTRVRHADLSLMGAGELTAVRFAGFPAGLGGAGS